MKKFIFFTLWNVEKLERYLEEQAKNGYILKEIKHNYWFYFKKSPKINLNYFFSAPTRGKPNIDYCDVCLLANHHAKYVKTNTCHYFMFTTKDSKDNLSLLYEVRMDFIKRLLLLNTLSFFLITVMLGGAAFSHFFQSSLEHTAVGDAFVLFVFIASFCVFVYYFYGYLRQKKKCKDYECNKHK